ncbi:MAG: hypothetical protein SNJ29_09030 [Rikenellaceae bacterium]
MSNEPKATGRPQTSDPAKYKFEFRLTASERDKFQEMFTKSGCKTYSEFIRKRVFSEQFHVTIADENTIKFYDELKNIKSEIRIIGTAYNSYIAKLRQHFTETRAAEISTKSANRLTEIVRLNEQALSITLQLIKRWIRR